MLFEKRSETPLLYTLMQFYSFEYCQLAKVQKVLLRKFNKCRRILQVRSPAPPFTIIGLPQKFWREMVPHEPAGARVPVGVGFNQVLLIDRGLGDLEEDGVGLHVPDLEPREVDAECVGLGADEVVVRDLVQSEDIFWRNVIFG